MKFAFASLIAFAAACSPYSPELGASPFLCGSGGECPDGYVCVAGATTMVCSNGDMLPDAGAGQCADDSSLEPNNTIATAHIFATLPTGGLKLAGLAICPAGDKDTYAVTPTTTGQTLQAAITFDANQAVLNVNILNSSGTIIANSQANGTGMAKASLVPVPSGGPPTYVQVLVSPTSTTLMTNGNYKLDLSLM
ncbi:MAG: hypothetical protein ABI591_08135 [Kofleriaceae bacterium]